MNANLKTETLEDLRQKKKSMHLKAFQVLIDDAQRLQQCEDFRPIIEEMVAIKGDHGDRDVAEYLDDTKYSDLVSEMLEVHLWSMEQLNRQSGKPLLFRETKKACASSVNLGLKRKDSQFLKSIFDAHKDVFVGIDGPSLIAAFGELNAPYIPDDIDIERLESTLFRTKLSDCTAQNFEKLLTVSCDSFFCKVSYESQDWRIVTRKEGRTLLDNHASHMHQSAKVAKESPDICHICKSVCRVKAIQFPIPEDQCFDLIPWKDAIATSCKVPQERTASEVFKKYCKGYLSKENVKAALAEIQAPIFHSECCDDDLLNDALMKSNNLVDFETFSNLAVAADKLEEFFDARKVSLMADAFRPLMQNGLQLSQADTIHECILRLAANVTSQSLLLRVQSALKNGQEKQKIETDIAKCKAAVFYASMRSDEGFLRNIFRRHRGEEGGISVATLKQALIDANAPVVPDCEADAAAIISRFDTNYNGLMDFRAFKCAVNAPDELAAFFREKQLPALADALRALVERGSDQLLRVSLLSAEEMRSAASAVCSRIPHQSNSIHEELQRAFALQRGMQTQFELQTQVRGGVGSKFSGSNRMTLGGLEDFHGGLGERVGMPSLDFLREMMREHCEHAGCDTEFTTGHYNITTTPKKEWLYVFGDENRQMVPCPAKFMTHLRRIVPLNELMKCTTAIGAQLRLEEVLALALFTGPMMQVYNLILRRYPIDQFQLFCDGSNLFATTIFVIVSAITKLARFTRVPEGTLLYRGLGGLTDLPKSFFDANENGCSGFMEWGFISMTTDRDVALGYSGVKQQRPNAMVMVVEVSSVDRGADISEFSQYPGEKEFLWTPCSFVQRMGEGRLEVHPDGGLVTCMPVKMNLNLKTETVEQIQQKKKSLHILNAQHMVEEVRYELGAWAKSAEAAARLQRDPSCNIQGETFSAATLAAAVVKQCEDVVMQHMCSALDEYIDDRTFRAFVGEILDTKVWATEKKELWMRDASQYIFFVQKQSLRNSHRAWLRYLRRIISNTAAGSSERASSSLKLLSSRTLVLHDVRECNVDGEGLMVQAGADGWPASDITAALAAGADIDATGNDGYNGVGKAAQYGHADSLAALLAAGGDVNKCDNDGRSPIHAAAQNGQPDCLKLLLDAGGDVNKCDNDGQSPIHAAAQYGDAYCLKLLLAAGSDARSSWNGTSALDIARQKSHFECVRVLEAALA